MTPTLRPLLGLGAVLLLACGGFLDDVEKGFTDGYREKFMTECMAERSAEIPEEPFRQVCACSLDEVLKVKTAAEMIELEANNSPELDTLLEPIVNQCVAQFFPEAAEAAPTEAAPTEAAPTEEAPTEAAPAEDAPSQPAGLPRQRGLEGKNLRQPPRKRGGE